MTDKPDVGRNPWWDPMGVWQQVGEPFADLAADQRLSGWGSSNALQALLDGLRAGLVGRPVVVGTGASRVAFSAEDVEWRTYKFTTVSARLSNVHTRFRAKPVLVAAPVDVSLEMTGERLSALLAEIVPALEFEITASGRMLVRHARRPRWGYVEARPVVEHGGLVLRPSGVGRGARLWRFSRQIVPVRPKIALPDGVRITGVDVHPHRLEVQLRIDEWRLVVSDLASLLRKSR